MIVTLYLPDELIQAIAKAVAEQSPRTAPRTPYTVEEFAKALNVGRDTIYRRIEAGEILIVPGMRKKLIPATELDRLLTTNTGGNGK